MLTASVQYVLDEGSRRDVWEAPETHLNIPAISVNKIGL
jgi:hypothetical protein